MLDLSFVSLNIYDLKSLQREKERERERKESRGSRRKLRRDDVSHESSCSACFRKIFRRRRISDRLQNRRTTSRFVTRHEIFISVLFLIFVISNLIVYLPYHFTKGDRTHAHRGSRKETNETYRIVQECSRGPLTFKQVFFLFFFFFSAHDDD